MRATRERGRTLVSGYLRSADSDGHATDAVFVDTDDYSAHTETWHLGRLRMSAITEPTSRTVEPDARIAKRVPQDRHMLGTMLDGTGSLTTADRSIVLRPGVITLYASASPFVLRFDAAGTYLVTELPNGLLAPHGERLDALVANTDLATTSAARMVADLLRHLPGQALRMPSGVRGQLGDTVTSLMQTAIGDYTGRLSTTVASAGLVDTILAWIDLHLGELELSPARIAAGNHVSVRYLHKIFRAQGTTVGEHVRRRRLDRIKQDLLSPEFADRTIASIGARWGIPDATQLGRQFRALEGMPPSEWRRLCAPVLTGGPAVR